MAKLSFGSACLPEDWVINASINLVGPADRELPGGRTAKRPVFPNVNVTVTPSESEEQSAEVMRDRQAQALEQQLPKFRLVEKTEMTRDDGTVLPCLTYTFAPQPGFVVKQVQGVDCRDGAVIYITATAPLSAFDRHWDGLRKVMSSYAPAVDGLRS